MEHFTRGNFKGYWVWLGEVQQTEISAYLYPEGRTF